MGPKKENKKGGGDEQQPQKPQQPQQQKKAPQQPKPKQAPQVKEPPVLVQQQPKQEQPKQQPQQPQQQKKEPKPQQPKQTPKPKQAPQVKEPPGLVQQKPTEPQAIPQQPQLGAWGKAPPLNLVPQIQLTQQQQTNIESKAPPGLTQAPKPTTTTTTTTTSNKPTTTTTTTTTTAKSNVENRQPRGNFIKDYDIEGCAIIPTKSNKIQTFSKPIDIITNFFPITFKSNRKLYLYHIEFSPEQFSRDSKFKLVNEFLFTYKLAATTKFDGGNSLFSASQLTLNSVVIQNVTISIKETRAIDHTNKLAVQFFNVLTKNFLRIMGYSIMGRDYFSPIDKRTIIKYNLEIWRGKSTSIIPCESGTMLLADLSSKVVRTQTVLQTMNDLKNDKKLCEQDLVGSIVLTRYNNKTYRISGIDWDKRVNHIMAGNTTFLNYYQSNYPDEKINDLKQPLLMSKCRFRGKEEIIYLIPELTYLTGLSDKMRGDRHLMMDLAQESNIEPSIRLDNLTNFVGSFEKNQKISKELDAWGVAFNKPQTIKGVVLEKPRTKANNNSHHFKSIKWAFISDGRDYTITCKQSLETFINLCNLPKPDIIQIKQSSRSSNYTDVMEPYVRRGYTLFLIIIPQNNKEVYRGIKIKSFCEFNVLTQCIFLKTFEKGKQVALKLKSQIEAKLGLAPWCLEKSTFNGVPKRTMIIGIDVGHNSDMRGHSVVGFVATVDDKFTQFHSQSIRQKKPGKEIIDTLKEATERAMKKYFDINNNIPELVIVYRDGVGDGMLHLVKNSEIDAMKEAFALTPSSWGLKPKLMYCIVKKNSNARFFTDDSKRGNPVEGTLVDHTITRPGWYDFFLVSQIAFKGSINPTHYHVLYDDYGMPPDYFQYFTYLMCYLYFNFEKSVRTPSTCFLAHKIAFLIGRTVNTHDVLPDLYDKLFYL